MKAILAVCADMSVFILLIQSQYLLSYCLAFKQVQTT